MNEDDMGAHEELAGDELERLMERYARVRLDPGQAATRRARAAVMEEAWRRHLAAGSAAPRRGLFAGWSMRRLTGTLAAAVMAGLLVGSSVFAASRAGGPLYGARLIVDDLTLPADPASRLEAELAHAQTRLAEAVDASARGDQDALDASLEAYGQVIASLATETGAGAQRALEAVLVHRTVLEAVLADSPAAAVAGLDRAIAQSDALIRRLDGALSPGTGPGGAGQGGQPAVTPKPTRDPKAEATPKPTRDPKAEATPTPERTPKPRPTPDPPGRADPDDEAPSP